MMNQFFPPFFHNGIPHQSLLALFSLLNIAHDNTLSSMVEESQATLLRSKNQERWEVHTNIYEDRRDQILHHLKMLGFVDAMAPMPGSYDYLVIFGFVTSDVGGHMHYLAPFTPSFTIQESVLLSSMLRVPEDSKVLSGLQHRIDLTEAQAMELLYKESPLSRYPYTLINVPMLMKGNELRRPNTEDTVDAWLTTSPRLGRCLVLSGQPFIRRQTRILEGKIPSSSFIPAGPSAEKDFPIALYLDELARALYQEQQYQQTLQKNLGSKN